MTIATITTHPPWSSVDLLFGVLLALSGLVTLTLVTLVLWFCVRYRAGSSVSRDGAIKHVSWAEATWISATLLAFLVIAAWANADFVMSRVPPRDAYTVYAVGKQWMWKLEHPAGRREINQLHVPVGRPVRVVLTSEDVIHSFYLPSFRVKQDALPGRYTSLWFEADEPGVHPLFCAEYCGAEHSGMVGRVIAMPADDFSRWLDANADRPSSRGTPGAEVRTGEALFYRVGCSVCHSAAGRIAGPRLDGIWGMQSKMRNGDLITVDDEYVRESILHPNAKIVAGYPSPSAMPSYEPSLTDEQVDELVEYIRSIRTGWSDEHEGGER